MTTKRSSGLAGFAVKPSAVPRSKTQLSDGGAHHDAVTPQNQDATAPPREPQVPITIRLSRSRWQRLKEYVAQRGPGTSLQSVVHEGLTLVFERDGLRPL